MDLLDHEFCQMIEHIGKIVACEQRQVGTFLSSGFSPV